MAEIKRVLRPGGTVIITVPLVWEYDRTSAARPVFVAGYLLLNAIAAVLDHFEARTAAGTLTLPMNLFVQARRPASA